MATRDKAAGSTTTIRTLSNTAAWVGGVVPISGDDARWISTSSSGTHTGSITCDRVIIEGATGNITYTTGTITFVSTGDFFRNINNSGRTFTLNGGTLALGGANRDCRLYNSTGAYTLQLFGANSITGTAASVINVINHLGTGSANNAYIVVGNTQSGFLGTVRLTALSGIFTEAASSATSGFNAATIICDGAGWLIGPAYSSNWIGGSGRTLTINEDGRIGWSSRSLTALSDVQLAGTGTRTLEVLGNTTMSGTVTGTAGVTVAGASKYTYLAFDNATTSGLTGPCTVSSGDFQVRRGASPYVPSTLSVASDARFLYYQTTADFTYDVTPTGLGIVAIGGNLSGNGVTFPASPSSGNIAAFDGFVQAIAVGTAGSQTSKIRISELPSGLSLVGYAASTTAMTAQITYTGAGQTKATAIVIDSENNTSTATLTSGTYSLLSSGSGPIVLSGTVQRTNSSGAVTPTASARMDLTLGGTNVGNNTLSGVISDLSTNSATLGIRKADLGRWVLSGDNTHRGLTTVVSGTLALQSNTALGSTTEGDITLTGGALRLEGVNRSIVKTGKTLTFGGGTLEVAADSGDASLTCGPVTITGNNGVVNVESGSSLSLNNAGLITGSLGLIKNGVGSFSLPTSANTFTGDFNINDGDVSIGSIANSGSGASWGAGTSPVKIPKNLKINGTGGTTNRPVMFVGSTPSIESAGAGTVTFSATSQGGGNRTITLKGDNTGNNTFSGPLKESGLYQSMPLNVARSRHASIGLQNGKVLVLGGNNISSSFNSCELYDPATESWTITGAMNSARFNCDNNALLLNNGKVLVVAGSTSSAASSVISATSPSYNCELFNPSTNSWSAAASTAIARTYVNTTLLNDGRVLMTGGFGSTNNVLNTCQIYTPDSGAGSWTTNTPAFTGARYLHTTTLLSNGNVLLVGGWTGSASVNTFQVFDPAGNSGVGSWNASSTFSAQTRYGHIAVPIFNKTKVLIAGGAVNSNTTGNTYSTCLVYDIASGWTSAAPMNVARYRPTYQVLSDGRVFVAGGSGNDGTVLNSAEIYDPALDTWTLLPDTLASVTSWPGSSTLSLANDDRVLISGGYNSNSTVTNICSTYNPSQTLALTKSGTGKWILGGGTLTYSGTTVLEAGTLDLGGTSRVLSGGITMSGGTLQNGSATLESDVTVTGGVGSITAQLAGTSILSMTGGTVTLTQSDSNAYTGGTTIGAGATLKAITSVDPSAVPGGKVLGDGTVTVSGTLRTGSSSTQRGQLRYGGTLTFNGGSKIYLGGA